MTEASTTTPISTTDGARRWRPLLGPVVLLIVAATAVNLGLYALGRAIDAAMMIDPAGGFEPNHALSAWDVAWKTAGMLAAGTVVAMLVAPRSRRWALALVWMAGALGISTMIGPILGAHDAATMWLMLGMKAGATLVGVLIALVLVRRLAPPARR